MPKASGHDESDSLADVAGEPKARFRGDAADLQKNNYDRHGTITIVFHSLALVACGGVSCGDMLDAGAVAKRHPANPYDRLNRFAAMHAPRLDFPSSACTMTSMRAHFAPLSMDRGISIRPTSARNPA